MRMFAVAPDLADAYRALILTVVAAVLRPQSFRLNQATLLVGFA